MKHLIPVLKVYGVVLSLVILLSTIALSYFSGFSSGYYYSRQANQDELNKLLAGFLKTPIPTVLPTAKPQRTSAPTAPKFDWSGPDLWQAVNDRRVENGVNPLQSKSEICTIASIRLNELLKLGDLDGHEGFSTLPERREDLRWIFEKYNLSEFLLYGAESPIEAVELWEDTLGHKKLLTGGEYVWGCVYAQYGFAVAITAY